MALVILAVGILVIVFPLSLLFRHRPEQYGYSTDGQEEPVACDNDLGAPKAAEVSVRIQGAIESGTFWRLALSFAYHAMVTSAAIAHLMPYLSSIGLDRSLSSLVAAGMPLVSIGGRLGLGWLGDKIDRTLVAAVSFAMTGFGLLCLGYASTVGTHLLVPFLILFGIGYGGGNSLRASLTREYFGRSSYGRILGLMMGVGAVGGIAGPTLAGWTYDKSGSYQVIWLVFACLAVVAVISVSTISPLSRKQDVV
jgi:MFS family permease